MHISVSPVVFQISFIAGYFKLGFSENLDIARYGIIISIKYGMNQLVLLSGQFVLDFNHILKSIMGAA